MNNTEICNATFKQNLTYGTPNDSSGDFVESSEDLPGDYRLAAHGLIFTRKEQILWERYKQPARILMQLRCCGNLGFPGGLVEENESVVYGLNRELKEEINFDLIKYQFAESDHLVTHINHKKKLVLHFYGKEVTVSDFDEIEQNTLKAKDWGAETFGLVRVPLFAMDDGIRGLPVFLANQFAGNARDQLIIAIRKFKLIPEVQLEAHLASHKRYITALNLI